MTETFTLRGSPPPRRGRRPVTYWVLSALSVAVVIWLVAKIFGNRPATLGDPATAAYELAGERRAALERILPGAKLPEPYVLRGAGAAAKDEIVWMRRDYDDAHAFLFRVRGADAPEEEQLRALAGAMGVGALPTRQLVDEPGVLPEKRPPFVEEFREPPAAPSELILPPLDWLLAWDLGSLLEGLGSTELPLAAGRTVTVSLYRPGETHWWAVARLEVEGGNGYAYLVHLLRSREAPESGELFDFLSELLRVR